MRPGSAGSQSSTTSSSSGALGASAFADGAAKKGVDKREHIHYSPMAMANNHHIVEYCRTSMSALAGSTAGIVGLTSLQGFAFYLIMVVVLYAMIMTKAGSNAGRYFTSKWAVLSNGFLGGLTTYVLFWTFLYGMVHVY